MGWGSKEPADVGIIAHYVLYAVCKLFWPVAIGTWRAIPYWTCDCVTNAIVWCLINRSVKLAEGQLSVRKAHRFNCILKGSSWKFRPRTYCAISKFRFIISRRQGIGRLVCCVVCIGRLTHVCGLNIIRFIVNYLSCYWSVDHFFIDSLDRYHFNWLFIRNLRHQLASCLYCIKLLNLPRSNYLLHFTHLFVLNFTDLSWDLLLILVVLILDNFALVGHFFKPPLRRRLISVHYARGTLPYSLSLHSKLNIILDITLTLSFK